MGGGSGRGSDGRAQAQETRGEEEAMAVCRTPPRNGPPSIKDRHRISKKKRVRLEEEDLGGSEAAAGAFFRVGSAPALEALHRPPSAPLPLRGVGADAVTEATTTRVLHLVVPIAQPRSPSPDLLRTLKRKSPPPPADVEAALTKLSDALLFAEAIPAEHVGDTHGGDEADGSRHETNPGAAPVQILEMQPKHPRRSKHRDDGSRLNDKRRPQSTPPFLDSKDTLDAADCNYLVRGERRIARGRGAGAEEEPPAAAGCHSKEHRTKSLE